MAACIVSWATMGMQMFTFSTVWSGALRIEGLLGDESLASRRGAQANVEARDDRRVAMPQITMPHWQ